MIDYLILVKDNALDDNNKDEYDTADDDAPDDDDVEFADEDADDADDEWFFWPPCIAGAHTCAKNWSHRL